MKKRERGARFIATAALLLAAVTSCADDVPETAPSPRATPPSSPSATKSTAAPPTETEKASESASQALQKYYDVRNQLRQDPGKPLTLLDEVAISSQLSAQKQLFKAERKQGLHQTGETLIADLEVQSVNLDNSDPKAGQVPTVQIDVCLDVSDVDVVDKDGNSVINPNRPATGWIQYLVSNYEWDTDPAGGWRVASGQDLERKPCEAL
ncbi:MAG: hypothetical protein ACRCYU_00235 [Nocardioides sp.]